MSRNFGIGSRDIQRAGLMFLEKSSLSFSSKATLSLRWGQFCKWAKEKQINKLESINSLLLIQYADYLQQRINDNSLSVATAQNYISAVNTVMQLTHTGWITVSPTKDCNIDKRTRIATENKAINLEQHLKFQSKSSGLVAALSDLERELGLRFKESALINAHKALQEAHQYKKVNIVNGTKGGRKRCVPVSEKAIKALEKAALLQNGKSMVPAHLTYKEFHHECYRSIENKHYHFHGERHFYAQNRYKELTAAPAPIVAGWNRNERIEKLADFLIITTSQATLIDKTARLQVAEELGHAREEISNVYLG